MHAACIRVQMHAMARAVCAASSFSVCMEPLTLMTATSNPMLPSSFIASHRNNNTPLCFFFSTSIAVVDVCFRLLKRVRYTYWGTIVGRMHRPFSLQKKQPFGQQLWLSWHSEEKERRPTNGLWPPFILVLFPSSPFYCLWHMMHWRQAKKSLQEEQRLSKILAPFSLSLHDGTQEKYLGNDSLRA